MRIGIDAGGTFTDFVVAHDDGRLEHFKLPSNRACPEAVILAGIERAAGRRSVEVVHGSTVATNALLERKGARTALIATAGFEDVIVIGRQNRELLYDLNPPLREQLVAPELRFGVKERTLHDGSILRAPSDLGRLRKDIGQSGAESVAICLLHCYANAANERAVARAIEGLGYITASHEICPEFREYERTSTTVLNSYVGPLIGRYVEALERGTKSKIFIMQSNGGFITAAEARRHAVRTLLSGPAGGAGGAMNVARRSGYAKMLGFDMGGTSTDVCLSEGELKPTMEASIGGFPIRVPVLDIHTVGAGGGSIARVDAGGLLRVGPGSAGADPGPACYGTGTLPTVTDAHVVLGRILPDRFLGGAMLLDAARARDAVASIAKPLGLTIRQTAEGILRVANGNMERAIRVVSVERGHDPREFALVAFGGCGGLHACEIAANLGAKVVLLPEHAGVLSAFGMLLADAVRDYSASGGDYKALERQARKDLPGAVLERFEDLRYCGQSYEITVPAGGSFHEAHRKLYGYASPERPVERTAIRVRATRRSKPLRWRARKQRLCVSGGREWLLGSRTAPGPFLLIDYGSSAYIPGGWTASVDASGTVVCKARA